MPEIQVFIATYNRPTLVINAINSALNQDFDSFEVVLSDNSTNDETENLISGIKNERLIYRKRKPSLPVIDHLNVILNEVTSEYFMIFHDDDLMYPDILRELYNKLVSNKSLIAVGANAIIVTPDLFPNRLMLKTKYADSVICNRDQMAYRYLVKRGIVPFPSYLYKCEVAKSIRFIPKNGGKHCDVAFMMDVATMGNIFFIKKPLMDYFISPFQDSRKNDFNDKVKLINYITRTSIYKKDAYLIKRFRIANLYYEILQDWKNERQLSIKRRLRIIKLIFMVSPFDLFPRVLFQLIK
jgi:glycosyltransferase involved in cell wall biosynthesis